MKRVILLAAAALLVAACAAPDPTASHSAGPIGSVDTLGPHASAPPDIASWASYREFNFDSTSIDVSSSDTPKLREIVAYLESNPSLDIRIDGTLGAEEVSQADRNLSDRRAASVRRALMDAGAGVASYKILMGPPAESNRGHAGQIQVLIGPRAGSPKVAL
jgi:outer membrane protein OmpA-like peptidoglycan-associated protein